MTFQEFKDQVFAQMFLTAEIGSKYRFAISNPYYKKGNKDSLRFMYVQIDDEATDEEAKKQFLKFKDELTEKSCYFRETLMADIEEIEVEQATECPISSEGRRLDLGNVQA